MPAEILEGGKMISCTEFILAYNELFKFLDKKGGKKKVINFWEGISDNFLQNLDALVKEKGIQGMKEYWTHTLSEEGGKHKITADENKFGIEVYECPSVKKLNEAGHIKKYPDYCKHCGVLYPRIIEKYGFKCCTEYIDEEKGICRVTIEKVGRV